MKNIRLINKKTKEEQVVDAISGSVLDDVYEHYYVFDDELYKMYLMRPHLKEQFEIMYP